MSEAVQIALIVAIGPALAGIGGVIASIMHRRSDHRDHEKVRNEILELHVKINSRMDELLTTTSALGRAEGVASEQERQKNT